MKFCHVSRVTRSTILALTTLLAAGCGAKPTTTSGGPGSGEVFVDVNLAVSAEDGFGLLSPSVTYTGLVNGCRSGRTANFSDGNPTVRLLVGDGGCVARLTSVVVVFADNTTSEFVPDSRFSFRAGTATIVAPNASGKSLKISVLAQLPAAIPSTDVPEVAMRLGFVESGTSQAASAKTTNAGVDIDVGQTIPYEISGIELTVDTTTGGGLFNVSMNCFGNVAGNVCESLDQTGFTTSIAVDSYKTSGVARNLTINECLAITALTNKRTPAATWAPGEAVLAPNGGVQFMVVGPRPLCGVANKDLVIATRHSAGESCKWWRLAVTCPE